MNTTITTRIVNTTTSTTTTNYELEKRGYHLLFYRSTSSKEYLAPFLLEPVQAFLGHFDMFIVS